MLTSFKEFYIPSESTSIHFLKSKLCVGCSKGFEVVSLETLETQSLLDPADTSLELFQRENVKPIAIYRLNGEFLLNYSDFSFFVNRNGWRARPDWQIAWEGQPTSFALSYPFILAFEPSFIEIRNVETGGLVHIVTGKNIRMLHESTREVSPINFSYWLHTLTYIRSCMRTKMKGMVTTLLLLWISGPGTNRNRFSVLDFYFG